MRRKPTRGVETMDGLDYDRAQNAFAMAKAEAWKLRAWLEDRARKLREEADAIDTLLRKSTDQTDSWYETIVRENDERRKGGSP
jgi:hypothetical protein